MKTAIVNFSNGKYIAGQERLVASLRNEGKYEGDILTFNNYDQVGSLSHEEAPYQFKIAAMYKAYQMGYDLILYIDASIYATRDISDCLKTIEDKGYLLEDCGFPIGNFSTDYCLDFFNINRDDAMSMKMHSAGFTGLNFKSALSSKFIGLLYDYGFRPCQSLLKGAWNNNNNACSLDERCKGHRHDQTLAAIIASNLPMQITPPLYMNYYSAENKYSNECCFVSRGLV